MLDITREHRFNINIMIRILSFRDKTRDRIRRLNTKARLYIPMVRHFLIHIDKMDCIFCCSDNRRS